MPAGTLSPVTPDSPLCVSGDLHIGGLGVVVAVLGVGNCCGCWLSRFLLWRPAFLPVLCVSASWHIGRVCGAGVCEAGLFSGALCVAGVWRLCVSDGWHIEPCRAGFLVMCEWRLSHWRLGVTTDGLRQSGHGGSRVDGDAKIAWLWHHCTIQHNSDTKFAADSQVIACVSQARRGLIITVSKKLTGMSR